MPSTPAASTLAAAVAAAAAADAVDAAAAVAGARRGVEAVLEFLGLLLLPLRTMMRLFYQETNPPPYMRAVPPYVHVTYTGVP